MPNKPVGGAVEEGGLPNKPVGGTVEAGAPKNEIYNFHVSNLLLRCFMRVVIEGNAVTYSTINLFIIT